MHHQTAFKIDRRIDPCGAAPPNGGRQDERRGKFKAYIKRMVTKERFKQAEDGENRRYVDSDVLDEAYATVATGKSVHCYRTGHEAGRQNECGHIP